MLRQRLMSPAGKVEHEVGAGEGRGFREERLVLHHNDKQQKVAVYDVALFYRRGLFQTLKISV